MVQAGASIEAFLKLNADDFTKGLGKSTDALNEFAEASTKLVKPDVGRGLAQLDEYLNNIGTTLDKLGANTSTINTFNKLANAIRFMSNGLEKLTGDTIDAEKGINIMNNIFKSFQGTLTGVEFKLKATSNTIKQLKSSTNQLETTYTGLSSAINPAKMSLVDYGKIERQVYLESQRQAENLRVLQREFSKLALGVEEFNAVGSAHTRALNEIAVADERVANLKQRLAQASNTEAMAEDKESVALDKATASMNKQSSASKSLKNGLSALKSMVTLVGSMIAYNFIHNLGQVTTETINAKSEMNGYFQMLGYSTSQVTDFNKALDETVKKFPRLNKYALGETISSIGVEFELTTAEMKKAMPVVSMITSEYLRAGRNVNEASLAVKDILQGEFQRLSRETGVKGDQLKEAGWSGDKTDVMGLLKALEKVGKERNWDSFVQKANSLNDAVLIVQNRFSEWSADMVERIQPAILGVFNDLMVIGTDFGKAFNKVLDWLGGNGLAQSIVKWGGLATAIIHVSTALIVYRTGANLTQIAQMGLRNSILATILGLEAEEVAEHGVTGAMLLATSQITKEELANYGRLNSIIAVNTGLKAEEVATIGKTKALLGSLLGVDMAILKEDGLAIALAKSTTQMELAEIQAMSYSEVMGLLALSVGLPLAVIGAFTGALVLQAIEIQNTTEKYKKFTDMVNKGDDIISEAKDQYDTLTNKSEKLQEKLDGLTKGTYEYDKVASQLAVTNEDLAIATQNYEDAVNSVAWAKHKQELYDEEKASAQASAQRDINQALIDYGYEVSEAKQLSSEYWNDAINGWDQHYETLQKVNLQYEKNAISVKSALDKLNNTKLDDNEVTVLIRRKISAGNEIANAKEELGNATSLTEYVDKWLWLQVKQLNNAVVDFDINTATGSLADGLSGLAWGLVHFFGDNFIGQFTQQLARDWGLEGSGSKLGEQIKPIVEQLLFGIPTTISDVFNGNFLSEMDTDITAWAKGVEPWFEETIVKPITEFDYLGWLTDAFTYAFSKITGLDVIGMLFDALLPQGAFASDGSSDHPSFMDDVSDILGMDVQQWIDNFNSDPLGTLGIELPSLDIGGFISSIFGGSDDADTQANTKGQSVGTNFTTGIQTGIAPLDGILNSAFNLDGVVSNFTSSTSTITSNASSTAFSVATTFSGMKTNHKTQVDAMASNNNKAFQDMQSRSNTELLKMRDSTSQSTTNMTSAWSSMRDSIVASAKKIQTDASTHFGDLGREIGKFYRNIQNPSNWGSGAGLRSYSRSPRPTRVRRAIGYSSGKHGAGVNPYAQSSSKTMGIQDLVKLVGVNEDVPIDKFLALFGGGFGDWNFASSHTRFIKNKAHNWDIKPAYINGIGSVGNSYKVERFNGTPHFTWNDFMATAESIFSQVPYKFYYDSEWKGNWVNALLSGATNCSDGSDALINLARVFGMDGYKQHTTLKSGVGHFFAVINGHKLDTTNFQQHGSWNPLGGAGVPVRRASHSSSPTMNSGNKTEINVTITGDVYGVDDLESKIEQGVQKGLREQFNDPLSGVV